MGQTGGSKHESSGDEKKIHRGHLSGSVLGEAYPLVYLV